MSSPISSTTLSPLSYLPASSSNSSNPSPAKTNPITRGGNGAGTSTINGTGR